MGVASSWVFDALRLVLRLAQLGNREPDFPKPRPYTGILM